MMTAARRACHLIETICTMSTCVLHRILARAERVYFNQMLPEEKIDEALFTSSRLHWASGRHPSDFCSSTAMVDDGSGVLWPLAMLLAAHTKISGTFVNIGAGTCTHPDPLYQLLASRDGSGFLGLAVEADSARLQRCEDQTARPPPQWCLCP